MNEQINNFLYPFSLTLLFGVSCIISFKRKSGSREAGISLSLMYWVYFYTLLTGYLNSSGFIHAVPHLFRTAQATSLLFMPLSFLYVSFTLNPRKLKWIDLLHLLPLILYLIDYSAFFLQPASEKMVVYEAVKGTRLLSDFGEGLFVPKGFHVALRYLVLAGYWIAQFRCLRKAITGKAAAFADYPPKLISWLKWLTITDLIIIIPPIINLIFPFEEVRIINQFSGILAALVQGYFLLFKPEILYGWDMLHQDGASKTPPEQDYPKIDKKNGYPSIIDAPETDPKKLELMDEIVAKLEAHFCQNKPYLREGYSLRNLADELGFTIHQLSYLINHHYGMNFFALINQYRIETSKLKLERHEYRQKTLDAIARESGFHSRATFIRAFKNQTGVTPSAFIRELT